MTSGAITLTVGWVGRHTPPGAGVDGRDAAVIDIAQDLLLRELHRRGVLDALAFKGGTSLRKLYAGNQGRFSLDLDFSVASPAHDPDTVLLSLRHRRTGRGHRPPLRQGLRPLIATVTGQTAEWLTGI
jgi:Nucleotidyl transferase AbiEii toxin, Type IV TA system